MTFFYTAEYFQEQITEKEKELSKLKKLKEEADVREFHRYIVSRLEEMDETFYNSPWTISFGGKVITLPNCAEVFQGIEAAIGDYMDVEGIHTYKEEE